MKKIIITFVVILVILPLTGWTASKKLTSELAQLRKHAGSYSFVVLGDNKSGYNIYKKLISLFMQRQPDFVINTGDLIVHPGNRDQWATFKSNSKPINVPYFLVVGNHDIDDKKSEQIWKQEADLPGNELYYSWTVRDSLFVVLDSCDVNNDKKIVGAQLAWLKRTLNPNKYKHQFVFLHHPLYLTKGAFHYGKSLDKYPILRNELQVLFAKKKVDIVFTGHEHAYYKKIVDDVWHITTGGGGARLYGKTFSHFVIVHVEGPRMELKVIDRDGVMRDNIVIRD